ncbi:hypothetical protein ACEWY4_023270 [Coilia grayii]|uniref:Uncharacterized protein n=1 Tax=Coilia grayii TaxID=363190 RepID=A0ABD1J2T0_9TELE
MKTLIATWLRIVLLTAYLTEPSVSTTSPDPFTAVKDEDVLLRCDCKDAKAVVWQTTINDTVIISFNMSASQNPHIHSEFKDRVRLFLQEERGNCSLLLLSVTTTDQRNYTCFGLRKPLIIKYVSLTVNAKPDQHIATPSPSPSSSLSASVFIGISVILALAVVLSVLVAYRWRRETRRQDTPREEVSDDLL